MADDAFDPDAFLASPSSSGAFDPDAYLRGDKPPKPPLAWSDVPLEAAKNIPASTVKFATDIIHPIIHPIDTAVSLGKLGHGVLQKTGMMSGDESVPYADALGKFFVDRYGSMENVKQTLASDPVGVAADLSVLLTGGETAAARVPGLIGETARAVGSVGRAIDPLTAVGAAGKQIGKGAAEIIGGVGTHTGGESIRRAAQAGYEGGEAARAFQENLRGNAAMDEVVGEARNAVKAIRQERSLVYREGMAGIAKDPTILDFTKIDDALADMSQVKTFKGQVISPKTQGIRHEIGTAIMEWKALSPSEFHTAEGLDALKQKIGDIRDATAFGTSERVVADQAYQAIRKTIIAQAPEYAKVMKGYEEASKQIKEIERTLSLNPAASVDTALRKLQSVLRNNVNANYGKRAELAEFLVASGAPHLMEKLSGQALNSWMPRGLGKLGLQLGTEIAALGVGHAVAGAGGAGMAAMTLPLMSPRLVGESAYYIGKGAARLPARHAAQSDYLAGRNGFAHGGRINPDNIDADPSEAQKKAGNYAKDHVHIHGLDITVENHKGGTRSGVDKSGKPWSGKMPAHYGYIKGTVGKDKDHVDVYLGPHPQSPRVFVVDQRNAETGSFDEHKAFIGFPSKAAVVACYRKAFSDGRADERLGHVAELSTDQFKHWLGNGDTTKPIKQHDAAPVIVRKYDVPYLAGSSNDGRTVYIDRRVPRKIAVRRANGKGYVSTDPAQFLAAHESAEHKAMLAGKPYAQAHAEDADSAERAAVRAAGLDWGHYEKILDGLLSHIEHEKPKRPPPDLYLKPYPHNKRTLLARLERKSAA